jgi:hypothetical protein
MNKAIITCGIIAIIILNVTTSSGQTDSARRKMITYLAQSLKTDTGKAGQVLAVQAAYKQSVQQVMNNTSLTDQQKRLTIEALIDAKNGKLKQLLSLSQLNLMVPMTERRRNWQPDTTANTSH